MFHQGPVASAVLQCVCVCVCVCVREKVESVFGTRVCVLERGRKWVSVCEEENARVRETE